MAEILLSCFRECTINCINFISKCCRKFISKINFNTREDYVLKQFERVSNAAFSGLVDEAAYFRGMGRKNNLNMNELRKEVMNDLNASAVPSSVNSNGEKSQERMDFSNIPLSSNSTSTSTTAMKRTTSVQNANSSDKQTYNS